MNIERLRHGITVLQGLIEDHVNDGPDRVDMNVYGSVEECGTVACIAGWFTLDPVFRAQGLEYESKDDLMPHYGKHMRLEALCHFFEIDDTQVRHIFGSGQSDQLEHAIMRIEQVLDGIPRELYKQIRLGQMRQEQIILEQRGMERDYDDYQPHNHT